MTDQARERGSTIIVVLGASVLLMSILAASLSASDTAGNVSTKYLDTSQAALAAQSGLAVELSDIHVTAFSNYPCGSFGGYLSAPGAVSSYSGTVTYYPSGTTTALSCTGSTLGGTTAPASATVVSKGVDSYGPQVTMEEQVAIAATSIPAVALGYAIFTENALDLTGAATVNATTGNTPDIYSGGTLTCGTGDSIAGPVTTYASVDFSGTCSVTGLTASGPVTLGNSATVNGNVISYAGPLALTGSGKITGNATETNGNITLANSGTISGNAFASGSITLSGGSSIGGTQTPMYSVLSSQTPPTAVSFPVLDPSVSVWQGQGWNVVQIPGTVNGVAQTCATYFQSNSSGAADPFQTAIAALTSKTVFYAPTCAPSYSRTQTFSLASDAVLQVQSFTTVGSDTSQSTSATRHDFSLLANVGTACSTANTDVSVSNSANFASSLTTFIYTPGQVSYANSPSMTGQIVACGGVVGSNSFALSFDPSASLEIPGSTSTTAPTVAVTNKFVV